MKLEGMPDDSMYSDIEDPSASSSTNASNIASSASHPSNSGQLITSVQGCRSTDLKIRACDECRKRKTACYILENSDKCFRCKMEDIECTFTATSTKKVNHQKPLGQPKARSNSVLEDYANLPGKSLLKRTLSLQHLKSSFTVADSTLFDKIVLSTVALDKNNQAQLSPNLSLRRVSPDTLFIVRSEPVVPQWVNENEEIDKAVAPYGWALVNCYFQHCQPVNPILHEKVFIEKYQRNYRELMPSLLGGVYCLGLKWWYHSNDLCTTARPGHLHGLLYHLAVTSFFAASGRPTVPLVQSGLLLLQCANGNSQTMAISSVITNLAYRLSLNTNCLNWKLPKWERYLRVRLSWAIYCQNRWICLEESLPSPINEQNWELVPLGEECFELDGMREPQLSLFSSQCRLGTLINDIHNLISNVPPTCAMEDILTQVKPIQIGLRKFHQELGPEFLGHTNTNVEELSETQLASFSLQLSYISAEIILHRFIITRLHEASSKDAQLAEICRNAAESRLIAAVDLVVRMKSQHVQNLYFFNAANNLALIGVFAALMQMTTVDVEKKQLYATQFKTYMQTLKLFSEYDIVSSAIRLLSSSIAGVSDLMGWSNEPGASEG